MQRGKYLLLGEIAVELGSLEAKKSKHDLHLMRSSFGAEENDASVLEFAAAERDQQGRPITFPMGTDSDKLLDQPLGGGLARIHHEADGSSEGKADELVDVFSHSGRKQHGLALLGAGAHNFIEFIGKPILEHPIGFVHYEDFDGLQTKRGRVSQMVDKTARCSNNKIRLGFEGHFL